MSRPAIAHKMLIESDPYETRIAVLEDDRLAELFVERRLHRGVVGDVYKGRVTRVLPGMQAAFVDIGLERDAFLYVADAMPAVPPEVEPELEPDEVLVEPPAPAPEPRIDTLLRPGQDLLVQVTKDPMPNKGARVTTHVTLPGRFLVLLPSVPHLGVSRRIEEEPERQRLREVLEGLPQDDGGLIVRTAGEGRAAEEFASDQAYLAGLWRRIRAAADRAIAPALVHRELDLALRVVRDLFSSDYSGLWVDGEETYARIVDFLDHVQPGLVERVRLADEGRGLFERFGIETAIAAALRPKVWLPSGGYLVIHPTEALVAIDVNSGRYVGRNNLEETALTTNLEAVVEVVRQIRLRDLGGILVIDFIDMVEPENRERVFAALGRELERDRAKSKVLSISEFGLVEITRERTRANLERQLTSPCPACEGSGRIPSVVTTCLKLRRELLRFAEAGGDREFAVRVHPEVARALRDEEHPILEELERALGPRLLLQEDSTLHRASFDILEV
ncbi:MAG TPA: Rne/Rng family ribonuclease [Thermoanaerobaculia bacterium]|nr:Rne/Rng family ribonuclease [Thermoanaerobaculia bacterium]